jgi:hypothetical protein
MKLQKSVQQAYINCRGTHEGLFIGPVFAPDSFMGRCKHCSRHPHIILICYATHNNAREQQSKQQQQ